MSPTLTMLRLTRAGQELTARDWHTLIAQGTPAGDARVLWSWPRPDLIVIQGGDPMDTSYLTGLTEHASHTPAAVDWQTGDHISLSGLLNPAKTANRDTGRKYIRPLDPSEVTPWLAGKLHDVIDVDTIHTWHLPSLRFQHTRGQQPVQIARVGVRITGTVTDADALRQQLATGTGRGRAYGCGLLIARRLS